jgi:FkbM family methyltransferase
VNRLQIPENNLGTYIIPKDVNGGIAVDIGCNVGSFLKRTHNIFSLIHYYEPIKECFDICNNFAKDFSHIVGHNVAVANCRTKAKMVMHDNCLAGSSAIDCLSQDIINLEHRNNEIINEVETITLEDLYDNIGNQEIDYCKCDCEISEYQVFINKDISPIKYLGIELHWQMGEERYDELLSHIIATHKPLYGNLKYPGRFNNNEILFARR